MLKYALCELDELGNLKNVIKIFEKAYSTSDVYKRDIDGGMFPAVFVSREDVRRAVCGDDYEEPEDEDVFSKLSVEEMLQICEDLQDAYVAGAYWDDLACICEDLKPEDADDEDEDT
jgi:hypothetical protein